MNTIRKIQLAAAMTIANGVLALGLIASSPALAGSCTSQILCFALPNCPSNPSVACASREPPGCTVASAMCLPFINCQPFTDIAIQCNFH